MESVIAVTERVAAQVKTNPEVRAGSQDFTLRESTTELHQQGRTAGNETPTVTAKETRGARLTPAVPAMGSDGKGERLQWFIQQTKGFHVGDARVKKLTPASKRSIGRHVEF